MEKSFLKPVQYAGIVSGTILILGILAYWIFKSYLSIWPILFLLALGLCYAIYIVYSVVKYESVALNKTTKAPDENTQINASHALLKDISSFILVVLTTVSLLFTAFADTFYSNRNSIFDTILYSLFENGDDISDFIEENQNNKLYVYYDLSGSWEKIERPSWYDSAAFVNLNSTFNPSLSYVEEGPINALELAKYRTGLLFKQLYTQSDPAEIKVFIYQNNQVKQIQNQFNQTGGSFDFSKATENNLNPLLKSIYDLQSQKSEETNFNLILSQILLKLEKDVKEEESAVLIIFSDFLNYSKNGNNEKINVQLIQRIKELYHKNIFANLIISPPYETLPEDQTTRIDTVINKTIWKENVNLIKQGEETFPNDILRTIKRANNRIELYCRKGEEASFRINPDNKVTQFSLTQLIEEDELNKPGMEFVHRPEGKPEDTGIFETGLPKTFQEFNGHDELDIIFKGEFESSTKNEYYFDLNILNEQRSQKFRIEVVFLEKIPVWAAQLFFINSVFILLAFVTVFIAFPILRQRISDSRNKRELLETGYF